MHSDKFRVQMLAQEQDIIWADTDAYCVKPFTTENGHLHGWLAPHEINGGVLALQQDSPTLFDLIDYTNDPLLPDPAPWFPPKLPCAVDSGCHGRGTANRNPRSCQRDAHGGSGGRAL